MEKFRVKAVDVWKTYDGRSNILAGVNLDINPGEMVLISGRSGSGKTTLLNLIGCIDAPTKGSIFLNGYDISKLSEKKLADIRLHEVGIVFQSHNLLSDLSVYDNVLLPLKLAKNKSGEKRVDELLSTFDLNLLNDKRPNEISGGERQRVAIARALANNPSLLLADEPTSSLDLENFDNVMKTFARANELFDATIIIASHDTLVGDYMTKKYVLHDGKTLIEDETSWNKRRNHSLKSP
jgi:putative ABC transport system ATP-binding protein